MDKYRFQIYREGLYKDTIYKYNKMNKDGFKSNKEAINSAIEMIKQNGTYAPFTWYIVIVNEKDENKEEDFIRYQKDNIFVFKDDKISKANLNMFKDFLS